MFLYKSDILIFTSFYFVFKVIYKKKIVYNFKHFIFNQISTHKKETNTTIQK